MRRWPRAVVLLLLLLVLLCEGRDPLSAVEPPLQVPEVGGRQAGQLEAAVVLILFGGGALEREEVMLFYFGGIYG